jgi:hypothetical protein
MPKGKTVKTESARADLRLIPAGVNIGSMTCALAGHDGSTLAAIEHVVR